ncbi:MAG: type I glutamate--ammonia ligase [Sorangiineae bacterium NIC37A_2]|nr:MAG: type I glutamate--ammonia ligase [Sorangiineae bacterium NIC37A_2]
MSTGKDVLDLIKKEEVEFLDIRFTDTKGKEQHVTIPAAQANEKLFTEGKMFDGSSIAGWKPINDSDMILLPDAETAVLDPFAKYKQLNITADVISPKDMAGYEKCPRSIGKRALEYLKSTGIGDTAYFGPENEYFIFDSVQYAVTMGYQMFKITSEEGAWSTDVEGFKGHSPGVKGGYFPVPPVDTLNDIRAEMCKVIAQMGMVPEVHHHEVANAGQCEIGVGVGTLVRKADEVQMLKYIVHNVAAKWGKTATFMPKPMVGDNGNGMHVHQSIFKNGENLFAGDGVGGLSELAMHYIGGIIKHARAINAFSNPSTNSYKRLVPGFEAPTILTYSANNRSASIRIPFVIPKKGKRIETRFPDSTANPYLCFTALLMAGLDGIINKIDPGPAGDEDLFELELEGKNTFPTVAPSLDRALEALDADREFLKKGGVMNDAMIDSYIDLKMQEVTTQRMTVTPVEYQLYYSC